MSFGDSEEYISTDVLVVGGGLGGCFAAIKAAEEGANVVLFEKANLKRGGQNGSGIGAMILVHPDYNISFEEFAKLNVETAAGNADEDLAYEFATDTFDRILDLESYGLRVRDDNGSFHFVMGADVCPRKVRIWAPGPTDWHELKPVLARKVKSYPNVTVFDRTTAIGLLTKDGAIGSEVIGAVGMGTRTGKFVICEAKAVVMAPGDSCRLQRNPDTLYAPTRFITPGPPTNSGEGLAMGYRAGADIINMEFAKIAIVWKDFIHDGAPVLMQLGRPKTGIGEADLMSHGSGRFGLYRKTHPGAYNTEGPLYLDSSNVEGWPERKGEMQRVLWALESEGNSVGNFQYIRERSIDIIKDPVEVDWRPMMANHNNQSGIHIDVNSGTSLKGLYCAGDLAAGGWRQSSQGGYVFGARAGRNAAEYARNATKEKYNKKQAEAAKHRILEALNINPSDGYSWIELEDKARRIATDYGPPLTNDPKLIQGLEHLERIKTRYLPKLYARNPREMMRVSEVEAVFVLVEAFLRAALFRKESRQNVCSILYKTEYPERDDKNWLKHTLIQNVNGEMKLSKKDVKRLKK